MLKSMEFSASNLIAGLLFGTIGFWIFKQSIQKSNLKLAIIAVVMILWTYFAPNDFADWIGCLALSAAAYHFWRDDS